MQVCWPGFKLNLMCNPERFWRCLCTEITYFPAMGTSSVIYSIILWFQQNYERRSPWGVWLQHLQQVGSIKLYSVDLPSVKVQQAAARLFLCMQHRHISRRTLHVRFHIRTLRLLKTGNNNISKNGLVKKNPFSWFAVQNRHNFMRKESNDFKAVSLGQTLHKELALPERKREWQSISCCLVLTQWRKWPCRYTSM